MELPEWVLGSEVEKVGVRGRKSSFQGEAAWRLCGWIPTGEGIFFSTMPTYEYVCEKCGAHLDIFQSMKDAALKTCPKDKCPKKVWGKGKIQRQLGTGAGFIFKGSGFYITDYRSAGYKKAAKEAGGGGAVSYTHLRAHET